MRQYMIYDWHKEEYLTQVFTSYNNAQRQADRFNAFFPTGNATPQYTVIILQKQV